MSKSKTARLRRTRRKLMADDPHCWYCGTEVIEAERYEAADRATIEHLFHRLRGARPALGALVLSCKECNNERNRYSEQLAGRDLLRQRARMNPCACGCGELARRDYQYVRGHGDDRARVYVPSTKCVRGLGWPKARRQTSGSDGDVAGARALS